MIEFNESNFYKALQDFFINNDKETFLQFLAEFYNRTEGTIDKNKNQDEIIKELRELYVEFNEKGIDNNIVREKVNYFIENSARIKNIISKLNINKNNIETTNSRIDNLIIHSGDGSVNNAEIIDGRTGIDGTSYTLIGNNIRETSNNIYSFINNAFDFKNETLTNLLNVNNMTDGKMIDANGNEVTQSGCSFTNDYLFLKTGESIVLNFATYFTIVRYTTNKTFVANIVVNNEDLPYIYTADSDMYLRFNVYNDKKV